MIVKFKEIANFVAGQSPKSEYYSENEGIPFLQGNRTFGTFYPQIDTYTIKPIKIANKGDILMSVRAPVGDLNFSPTKVCIGRGLSAITAKDGDNSFLFYALKYNINNLIRQSNGTTYSAITSDIINNMDIIIPEDKAIRKKISKLLYSIDLKIDNNNKIISELEQMSKTIYDYWFLQYEFPNEEGKPYKSSGGKMIWNDELGQEIPEGWYTVKVYEILSKVNNSNKLSSSEYKARGKYPIVDQSAKIICGYTDDDNGKIDFKNCIIFGDHTKIVKYIDFDFVRGADGTQVINSNNNSLPNYILYNQIKNMSLVSQGYSRYFKFLKDKYVLIPSKTIADKYMKIIEKQLNMIKKNTFENLKLTNIRDYLLPLLMNGQVGFKN